MNCDFCLSGTIIKVTKFEEKGWRLVDRQANADQQKRQSKRRRIADSRRARIYKRDGYKCVTCGCDDKAKLTLDHRIPISKGGDNSDDNLQTMCFDCNQKKADTHPEGK